MTKKDTIIGLILTMAAMATPLFVDTRYIVTQLTLFFIWATVVTQWNLVFGVAGIFSLAQMAIFSVGAYTTVMSVIYLGIPFWAALPLAGLTAMLFSILLGIACLRLRGPYVALLTFAVAQAMLFLIITDVDCFRQDGTVCVQLTGGVKGFARFGDFGFREFLGTKAYIGSYYVALVLLILATVFSFVIIRSPIGLAFRALRDNPGYAMARGVNRYKIQIIVFAVSSFFTGVAGWVYAGHFKVIGPNLLYMPLLVYLVAMMVLGGVGRAWGPLVGAAMLMLTDEALKEVASFRNIGIGLVIIVAVTLLPEGIAGWLEKLNRRRSGQLSNSPQASIADSQIVSGTTGTRIKSSP